MSDDTSYASDYTTLADVVAAFEADGYTGQMAPREGALVVCFTCREESPADEVRLAALRRTEGASDPADMAAVAAVECPNCSAKGTLVLHFGPDATPEEDEVLAALGDERHPAEGGVTPAEGSEPPA